MEANEPVVKAGSTEEFQDEGDESETPKSSDDLVIKTGTSKVVIKAEVTKEFCDNGNALETHDQSSEIVGDNQETNPYAYIENNAFTSEKFKIEIRGLPKYYGISELRKLLNIKLGLDSNKVKSPRNRAPWVYACFKSEEDRLRAIQALDNFKWKGSFLTAKKAEPAPDPLVKRRNEELVDGGPNKRAKLETTEDQAKAIQKSATPLCDLPYPEQLLFKQEDAKTVLRKLSAELSRVNPQLKPWIEDQKKINGGYLCKLFDIKSMPDNCDRYLNKCEFTIGTDDLSGEKTIGFRLGSYASGSVGVAPVDSIKTVPDTMKKVVNAFQSFVRQSNLEVFQHETLKGYWRQLTVRCGLVTGETMVIVGMHPQELPLEQLDSVKEDLKKFVLAEGGSQLNVDSLYLQMLKRKDSRLDLPDYELLAGKPSIEEKVFELRFKISPESFFQVNTKCIEVLMGCVKDLSNINKKTTVLDVCCGTGMIGLCLAKDCHEVLGVDIVEQAIQDAKENAEKNGVTNCQFLCGKADDLLTSLISKSTGENIVAVVDPPRAGIHQKAVHMLRKANNVNRMVYLSCNPRCAFKNFTEFCRPASKTLHGEPFVPVAAIPIDMFPHTNHYELVIYFERWNFLRKNPCDVKATPSEEMHFNCEVTNDVLNNKLSYQETENKR